MKLAAMSWEQEVASGNSSRSPVLLIVSLQFSTLTKLDIALIERRNIPTFQLHFIGHTTKSGFGTGRKYTVSPGNF